MVKRTGTAQAGPQVEEAIMQTDHSIDMVGTINSSHGMVGKHSFFHAYRIQQGDMSMHVLLTCQLNQKNLNL